jgi:hypothetical protein
MRVTCADYNAFGFDPDGFVAHVSAIFYGPQWRPTHVVQQFVGIIQPPRYGPPASYQVPLLPPGFQPRTPPEYYGTPHPPYISPPARFDPGWFAALRLARRMTGYRDTIIVEVRIFCSLTLTLEGLNKNRNCQQMQAT